MRRLAFCLLFAALLSFDASTSLQTPAASFSSIVVNGCGMAGMEVLVPLGLAAFLRRIISRVASPPRRSA